MNGVKRRMGNAVRLSGREKVRGEYRGTSVVRTWHEPLAPCATICFTHRLRATLTCTEQLATERLDCAPAGQPLSSQGRASVWGKQPMNRAKIRRDRPSRPTHGGKMIHYPSQLTARLFESGGRKIPTGQMCTVSQIPNFGSRFSDFGFRISCCMSSPISSYANIGQTSNEVSWTSSCNVECCGGEPQCVNQAFLRKRFQ